MPDPALLTPLGQKFRDSAPVILRDDPDYLGIWHADARELERLAVKIELVRSNFFPQTADLLLKVWEVQVGTTIAPAGKTLDERRQIVAAKLLQMSGDMSGLGWQANLTALIGDSWTYEEHIPGDGASPPENTIRVRLPFPPDSGRYRLVEDMLREITDAHVDIVLVSMGGFLLDQSQMDQEGLGI
jgi:uncharacterized protein DUF2313